MYQLPTKEDLDRNLAAPIHSVRQKAHGERLRITSEFAARGMTLSTGLIASVAHCLDRLHEEAVGQAMHLVSEFLRRMPTSSPSLAASWARPHLQNLANMLLAEIPPADFMDNQRRAQGQYSIVFEQRLNGALRDIEIGFIEGRSIMTSSQSSQTRALCLLKSIYEHTRDKTSPVLVFELGKETGLADEESRSAWRYLKDQGLIQTFGVLYTARINAAGIDAIENARQDPDHPSPAFPSATYNIVNNTVHIGTANNSPVQQAGASSSQSQVVTYGASEKAELVDFIDQFKQYLDDLNLSEPDSKRAKAQLATIDAQLSDEPDPVIVKQAGKTLRNITEGAIGSLIAAGVQPPVWNFIADMIARLF
jgi:hypothetical protein